MQTDALIGRKVSHIDETARAVSVEYTFYNLLDASLPAWAIYPVYINDSEQLRILAQQSHNGAFSKPSRHCTKLFSQQGMCDPMLLKRSCSPCSTLILHATSM